MSDIDLESEQQIEPHGPSSDLKIARLISARIDRVPDFSTLERSEELALELSALGANFSADDACEDIQVTLLALEDETDLESARRQWRHVRVVILERFEI
ncbi:hypothetical protein EK0264_04155 [Epidermidibacterium keratini]|uniref:Uncharacterized protein n=1 Tax=Epidermidibacterium keratini TaxID=1891644 RepID=A0A7L4YKG9_9ACTN|nr:hypothetical protein [Epidermidibacterium keratini]QHB99557.1 hypothetical protein EK0264_04155 [Epidermidibacterium keratini]